MHQRADELITLYKDARVLWLMERHKEGLGADIRAEMDKRLAQLGRGLQRACQMRP